MFGLNPTVSVWSLPFNSFYKLCQPSIAGILLKRKMKQEKKEKGNIYDT